MSRRILFVTETAFYPPYQGDSARLFRLLRFFRDRRWHVTVVHFHDRRQAWADYAAMGRLCDDLRVYRPSDGELARRGSGVMDDWCPDRFVDLVARAGREQSVVAALVQFVFFSRCLDALPARVFKVLDADNVFAGRREMYAAKGLTYDWFSTDEHEERRGLTRADLLLAIQEEELDQIRSMTPSRRVLLVPHTMNAERLGRPARADLLFVGAANCENVDGLRRFLDGAWPAIRACCPATCLLLAGSVCDVFSDGPGVQRLGVQPSLRPVYGRAAVALSLARCGTGLKIKTVEALCYGKCLVSTRAGVQGLMRYPETFVVEETPEAFAEPIVDLLQNAGRAQSLGERAYHFAARYFDPATVLGRLERALHDAIGP